jgi:imidazolonepropionase-like amidohydrolase
VAVTVFTHARLVDGTGADPVDGAWVRVSGDRITGVGTGPAPGGADRVVDCAGRVLMPGLIDAHGHLAAVEFLDRLDRMPRAVFAARVYAELADTLARGFTTVRDAGMLDAGFRDAVAAGLVPGPRLFVSNGPLSQTGGHGDGRPGWAHGPQPVTDGLYWPGLVVDGVAQARWAAREVFRCGADQVKVMASGGCASPTDDVTHTQFSDEELAAIVGEARARGSYVLAHAYNPASILACVRAGVRTVEHGNLMDEEAAHAMAAAGTFLVPTVATYELLARDGADMGMPANQVDKIRVVLERAYDGLRLARDAGVRIGSGSDLLGRHQPAKALELELKARVLGPMGAVVAATATNAEIVGMGADLGTVQEGRIADLLLVDGDPLDDVAVLQRPEALHLVVQGGRFAADRRPDTSVV